MSTWAVVVAAGRGTRANMGRNKVFCSYGGESVLKRCLRSVRASDAFDGVLVVLSPEDMPLFSAEDMRALADRTAVGGSTRQESVYNGLLALPDDVEIVAVHDAARPFAGPEIFRATVEAARESGSGVISMPVVDTVKRVDPATGAVSTLDRSELRTVQTPQTFRYDLLLEAHESARREGVEATDDAALFERRYGTVRLVTVPGAEKNRKLTVREDFDPEGYGVRQFRVGTGYDAHRLREGRRLVLGGVEIPHDRGLDGHSDADVAVHALMDAILGALALGDIGRHFPDSDPAYEGISSVLLLEKVARLALENGYTVGNADVTIVAQRPKLAPFIPQMRERMAEAMGVPADRVSVKATTTERMGFEGEETGISAQAAVLMQKEEAR